MQLREKSLPESSTPPNLEEIEDFLLFEVGKSNIIVATVVKHSWKPANELNDSR